jgi:hypothetical protein
MKGGGPVSELPRPSLFLDKPTAITIAKAETAAPRG